MDKKKECWLFVKLDQGVLYNQFIKLMKLCAEDRSVKINILGFFIIFVTNIKRRKKFIYVDKQGN